MSKGKKRCNVCYGSGRVMGGGMMQHDCEECDGTGKIYFVENDIAELEKLKNEHNKSYDKAIKEITNLDPNLSEEKAKEIFDEEFKRLEQKEKNDKRKK